MQQRQMRRKSKNGGLTMKCAFALALLLLALPVKADSGSGSVTLNFSGTGLEFTQGGNLLDAAFSYDVTNVSVSSAGIYATTANSMFADVSFSSTGNLGTFTFVPSSAFSNEPQWTNGQGFTFDIEPISIQPSSFQLAIFLITPQGAFEQPQAGSVKLSVVPEASTWAMLFAGLLGLAGLEFKRSKPLGTDVESGCMQISRSCPRE
jgi:hypothetical protein